MRLKRQTVVNFACLLITVSTLILYYKHCYVYEYADDEELYANFYKKARHKVVLDENQVPYEYGPDLPLIFIGGFPRSGTTLMRAMLDAHPDVRCGEETRVIPRILGMRSQWKRSDKEWKRLQEAGITDRVLDSAISSFILEVIAKHGRPAKRFCNKDPFALKSVEYLSQLFPRAKFVLMLRDGRAVIHSVISRKVTITGFDLTNHRQCLQKWNDAVSQMYHQCYLVGDKCLPVYYEQLVLEPERWMREILQFLDLGWNDSVLHHEMFIGKQIRLSKTEKSSDQVIKPVYTEALTKWVGQFPNDVVKDMASIAPMLAYLGYDPKANPPNYSVGTNYYKKIKNFTLPTKTVVQHNSIININQSNNYSASTSNNNNNEDNHNNNNNDIKTIDEKLVSPRMQENRYHKNRSSSDNGRFITNFMLIMMILAICCLLLPKFLS